MYKRLRPPNVPLIGQYQMAVDGAQIQDKESARSLVTAAQGTVEEVAALLQDARLTAPESGQISAIFPKRGELVGAGMPIMNLVVLDDVHVVLNVREDRCLYLRWEERLSPMYRRSIRRILSSRSIISVRWAVSLLGNLPSRLVAMTCGPSRYMPYRWRRWRDCVPVCPYSINSLNTIHL